MATPRTREKKRTVLTAPEPEESKGTVLTDPEPKENGEHLPTKPETSEKWGQPRGARTLGRDLRRARSALLGTLSSTWGRLVAMGPAARSLAKRRYFLPGAGLAVALAAVGIILALISTSSPPAVASAATVGGKVIPVSEVTAALKRFEATDQFDQLAEGSNPASARRQYERIYLTQQIKRLVLRAQAAALGIDIEDEVAKRLDTMRSTYSSDKAFTEALAANGYTVTEFTNLITDQLMEEKLRGDVTAEVTAGPKPSEEELKEYYESHRDDYAQTEVQQILVKEMSLARELSTQLRDSSSEGLDALLAQLAREHSVDTTSAENGGQLGWVSPGQFVQPVESAIEKLGLGEVSSPVSTDFGVYVIRVTGRRVQTFEDVKAQVSEQLTDMAAAQVWIGWLRDAYKDARIELNPRYGKFDPNTGQILEATPASS